MIFMMYYYCVGGYHDTGTVYEYHHNACQKGVWITRLSADSEWLIHSSLQYNALIGILSALSLVHTEGRDRETLKKRNSERMFSECS